MAAGGVEVSHVFQYGGPDRNPFQVIGATQTWCAPIMRCGVLDGRLSLSWRPIGLVFRIHERIYLPDQNCS
jgi:hypothetical protein